MNTGGWCARCGIHWVDDIRLPLCPVCADDERRDHEDGRRQLGWGSA